MATNFVEVLTLDYVKPHPNADKLDIAIIRGTTVVVPRGQYAQGQKVIYFPPDMLIPEIEAKGLGVKKYLKHSLYPGDSEKTQCRIGATRLRGQASFGFVAPLDPSYESLIEVNTDVSKHYQAVKYEPPVKLTAEDALAPHPTFHQYTDIEHYWRFPEAIPDGTPVRVTEKLHGTNSRVGLVKLADGEFDFMAGSHRVNRKKPEAGPSIYWEPLENENVVNLLAHLCSKKHTVILFGEIYGHGIQDMDYGVTPGKRGYRVFDISIDGAYLDWLNVQCVCALHNVQTVPLLYVGSFSADKLRELTDGPTTVGVPKSTFKGREGVVVTTLKEQFYAPTGGRRIVKSVSADYMDRKGAEDNA
jgi:RNA ligase (TIGR02306 family)